MLKEFERGGPPCRKVKNEVIEFSGINRELEVRVTKMSGRKIVQLQFVKLKY